MEQVDEALNMAQGFVDRVFLQRLLLTVAIALIAVVLLFLLKQGAKRHKGKSRCGAGETALRVCLGLLRTLVIVGGVLLILQCNGVNVTSLLAGLGIAGAVVGLALQDYLKDVIMGIHILSDHFFTIGECVQWQERELQIIGFTLTTTTAMDLDDHSVLHLCNREIVSIRRLGERRDVDIPLSYEENTAQIGAFFAKLAQEVGDLERITRCEYKGIQSFEASSVRHRLRLYCPPAVRPEARRAALGLIKTRLDEAGIKIPFEQLDVHLDKE